MICHHAGGFDASGDEEVDDDPGQQQTERLTHVKASVLIDGRRDVQRLAVEEVLSGWSHLTLLQIPGAVRIDGTLGPRQHRLQKHDPHPDSSSSTTIKHLFWESSCITSSSEKRLPNAGQIFTLFSQKQDGLYIKKCSKNTQAFLDWCTFIHNAKLHKLSCYLRKSDCLCLKKNKNKICQCGQKNKPNSKGRSLFFLLQMTDGFKHNLIFFLVLSIDSHIMLINLRKQDFLSFLYNVIFQVHISWFGNL